MLIRSLLTFVARATVTSSFAGQPCNAATTRGNWVYTCKGSLLAPALTTTRILGNCSGSRTA